MALGCDIRIATASAKLNTGFAKRGILPESGGTWLLPRMVGYAKAAELVFRAQTLTAAEALDVGIVNHAVADDEFVAFTAQVAAEIAANAPLAVAAINRTLRAGLADRVREATKHEAAEQLRLSSTADAAEGIRAVSERRPGDFTGS